MVVWPKARAVAGGDRFGRVGMAILMSALLCLSLCANAVADDDQKPADQAEQEPNERSTQGVLIRVPLPITGTVDNRVQGMISRAISRFDKNQDTRPVIVLEFSPEDTDFGEGSMFGRCADLADFLTGPELARVRTVAYVPQSVKGHAILAIMACDEIVMAPEASNGETTEEVTIGDIGVDAGDDPIAPHVRSAYKHIAEEKKTIPAQVALGMLDKDLEVYKVETEVSIEFAFPEEVDEIEATKTILSQEKIIPSGDFGTLTARQAREFGIAKYLATDRQAVAEALQLPSEALQEDPSLMGDWSPIQVELTGPITQKVVSQTMSLIEDERQTGNVNFILVRIDSEGGSLQASMELAKYLAELKRSEVLTVAYVPVEARHDAALIAMACDHVIMGRDAALGGGRHPADLKQIAEADDEEDGADDDAQPRPEPEDSIESLDEQAKADIQSIQSFLDYRNSGSWSLVAALLFPIEVHRYVNKESGSEAYFSFREIGEKQDPDQWTRGAEINGREDPLEVSGMRAKELGLSREVVDNFEEFKQIYGLQDDPRLVEPGWADYLIEALARPEVAMTLLILAGIGVIAELQMPGIGIGGFLAAVCFLVFFWSKYLHGTATELEIMLFLGGFTFLLLEIFILPGFGIFGLGGGLMIIVSLVLASQTFILPSTEEEFTEMRNSILVVTMAGVGTMLGLTLMRRYLPHAPLFNRLMLNPPADDEDLELSERESVVDLAYLVGQQGTTTTRLMPTGKAQFDDDVFDVISDGDALGPGTEVIVVRVRGNQVIVQPVERP